MVCNTGGSAEAELNYLTLLERQRAAGVVLTGGAVEGTEHTDAVAGRLARLAASGTRIVLCGRPPLQPLPAPLAESTAEPVITVAFDNRGARSDSPSISWHSATARSGTWPVPPSGPPPGTASKATVPRWRGGRRRFPAELERLTVHGYYDRSSGYDAALELLRREPGLTAVVAANDTVALGVCAALRDQGLRIPEDVSVAGFDDLPFSVDAVPALTTVRIPLQEAGARAGRLVMGRQSPPPGGVATVRTELMVRASTGAPRTQR